MARQAVTFVLDQAGIQALLNPGQPGDQVSKQTAEELAKLARQEAPGSLKQKIIVVRNPTRRGSWMVVCTADYSTYVHQGTRPHLIVPRNAKVLAFDDNGSPVFAMKVHHPGTAPNPFLTRAARRMRLRTTNAPG